MPSTMIVEVCTIDDVQPHPSADRLALAIIKGWQTAVRKDAETGETQFKKGDKCVFFPPDAILSQELAEKLGVIQYLSPVKGDNNDVTGYRVRACRLRGEVSYGFLVVSPEGANLGDNLAEFYKVEKWEPPERFKVGACAPQVPGFGKYTDIEYWGYYPDAFEEGEEVVITCKIHGCNSRYAYIYKDVDGERQLEFVYGSHNMVKKVPQKVPQGEVGDNPFSISIFWGALTPNMKALLDYLAPQAKLSVILFGEIAGKGVQKGFSYGQDKPSFFAFDIQIDGRWLDEDEKSELFKESGVPRVPVLYRGPYSKEVVRKYTSGPSMVEGANHIREGVVVTPVKERKSRLLRMNRLILKSVSADYLAKS